MDYAVPAADLLEYITLFYYFRADVTRFEDVERADYAQLRFRLSDKPGIYTFVDGLPQSSSEIHMLGPTCGPVHGCCDGPVLLFGMGLTPAGWTAMIGNDASQLLNRSVDATLLLSPSRLRAAWAAFSRAGSIDACVAIAEPLVRQLVGDRGGTALDFVRQVDTWLTGSPSPEIDDLVVLTGLSRRQVERKCNMTYGAPPKLLARKYRALRAAVALASERKSFGTAVQHGFSNQSHMIREIKEFTGMTPRQFQLEPTLLSQLVTAQRTALVADISPLISGT